MVEAYSPLVRGQKGDDATLTKLAEHHKKSPAQILIRYCLQKDWVPLPKSDTPSRIEENADVYDFHLSDEDMKTLDDLDQGERGSIGVYLCRFPKLLFCLPCDQASQQTGRGFYSSSGDITR